MANNLVKFVYIPTTATPEQIAAFDADTLYFINQGRKIYKGSVLYDGGVTEVAGDLQALSAQIGDMPVGSGTEYTDLVDYINKQIAAGDEAVEADLTTLDNSLAAVAKSGAAADVSVADADGNFTAATVEAVLAELAEKVGDGTEASVVTVEKTTGGANDDFVTKYTFSQGGTPITNGEITIAKDMVATSGELVDEDGSGNAGIFIKMTIANGTPFYIPVADLIEYNTFTNTAADGEIVVTDSAHSISMAIGKVAASKIIYRAADPANNVTEQTVAQAINALETAASTGVDDKITAAIQGLDSSIAATTGSVLTGLTIVDGKVTGKTEIALTAQNVAYGASNVKTALDTIGAIPSTATATTVVGYVDEKAAGLIAALDADLDATTSNTDTYAVAVVTGVTQVDGVITGVDSAAADSAGAATAVKAEVIGFSSDAATANTIYGAKAYTDAALTWGALA